MAEFNNTLDIIEDKVLTDSIIYRSITEFKDNYITKVGQYAFSACTSLISVDLPSVTNLYRGAFTNCASLVSVDLPSVINIQQFSFSDCANLTRLIIRTETMCSIEYTTALVRSAIEKGTGYIYVPKALLDTYKSNSVWKNYANQFRALEDYTVDGTTTGELDTTKI